MQILTLVTNLSQDQLPKNILENVAELMSELFDVPKREVLVSIRASVAMVWGPKPGVFALGTVQSTDPIEAEDTKRFAPALFEFFEQHVGIPQNRMYLGFTTLIPDNISFDGKLYSTILEE